FSAFVVAAIVVEFVRGTVARRAVSGEPWPVALAALIARNRRRYGGYVVHFAIVLLAIGIVGSSAYDSVGEKRLRPGETLAAGGYTVRYLSQYDRRGPNALERRADVLVRRGGNAVGQLQP